MFSKKIFTLFIGRDTLEPGFVTLKKEPVFVGAEAFAYVRETLPQVLGQVRALAGHAAVRVVLSEELVLVTGFSLPAGAPLVREAIRKQAEETIPENLQATEWDFQQLHYSTQSGMAGEVRIQVAVLESAFCEKFCQIFKQSGLVVESVLPESVVLAGMAASYEGVSLIAAQERMGVVLVAAESGFVLATYVKTGALGATDIATFLEYVSERKAVSVKRIIFSNFGDGAAPLRAGMSERGIEIVETSLNPLVGAALRQAVRGNDAAVLDIEIFRSDKKRAWWRF